MKDPKQALKDVISEGVAVDIFKSDQCISLLDEIGTNSEVLNREGFGDLFGNLQGYLSEQVILAITKIFERPSDRYPTRSIPSALKILDEYAEAIPIAEPRILQKRLLELGADKQSLEKKSDSELTRLLVVLLRKAMPSVSADDPSKLSEPMNALRIARDKKIAHHEAVATESMERTTWGKIKPLLEFAKKTVGIIGIAYLSTAYEVDDGEYLLTGDAKRAGRALYRLLKKAKLVEDMRGRTRR